MRTGVRLNERSLTLWLRPMMEGPPPPTKSPATSSRWLHSREKELIYNVFQFFSEEKANRGPIIPLSRAIERTVKATKVSEKTVRRICSGFHQASVTEKEPEQPVFSSPKKKAMQSSCQKHRCLRQKCGEKKSWNSSFYTALMHTR